MKRNLQIVLAGENEGDRFIFRAALAASRLDAGLLIVEDGVQKTSFICLSPGFYYFIFSTYFINRGLVRGSLLLFLFLSFACWAGSTATSFSFSSCSICTA
jgi:hypothetical protein